jgi:uncharacterized membrane protein YccC
MVSDDELERRIAEFEHTGSPDPGPTVGGDETAERLDRLESNARDVHEELARRIERTEASAADEETLEDLVARVEAIERRLEDLESEV